MTAHDSQSGAATHTLGATSLLSRPELAQRVALDIPDGAYVNLGIGVPTLVADYVPEGRHIVLQTENGMLGMGRAATDEEIDDDLINAGKISVTETPGCSYFHHADSFAMMRGGHLDVCVLGAYQVSTQGDLANWRTLGSSDIPGVGGAMDLAAGAKSLYVIMSLFAKDGSCKLLRECTYPLTAVNCVTRVYSDHALFALNEGTVRVLELYGGTTFNELVARSGLDLVDATTNGAGTS